MLNIQEKYVSWGYGVGGRQRTGKNRPPPWAGKDPPPPSNLPALLTRL